MGSLNDTSPLKQHFVLPLNGSKHYLMNTFKAVHFLEILHPSTSLVSITLISLPICTLTTFHCTSDVFHDMTPSWVMYHFANFLITLVFFSFCMPWSYITVRWRRVTLFIPSGWGCHKICDDLQLMPARWCGLLWPLLNSFCMKRTTWHTASFIAHKIRETN